MRIAQVVTYISEDGAFGGPVAVAIEQCVELARQGHVVHLYAAWDGRAKPIAPGVKVHLFRVPSPRLGLTAIFAPMLPIMLHRRRSKFDAVHLHFGRDLTSASAYLAVRSIRAPLILQPHGMISSDVRPLSRAFDTLIVRPAMQEASAVLALTPNEEKDLRFTASGGVVVRQIGNGININNTATPESTHEPEVLFLARLHPRKQVLVFAEAARILIEAGVEVTFRVIGPDEGDLQALRAFITRNNLGRRVVYDGTVGPGRSADALGRAAIYVLPSTGEVYPMTVLEAMARGTPVVLSTDCGLSERLGAADAVALTTPTGPDLAKILNRLLEDDHERAELGLRGQRYASAHFTIAAVAKDLLALYREKPKPRVAILQPYVPEYRIALWEQVITRLAAHGVEAKVFWGGSRRTLATYRARGDLRTPPWSLQVRTIEVRWSGRFPPLVLRLLPRGWHRAEVSLTEMQATNLNAWLSVLWRRTFVTMGHGASGTTTSNRVADRLESTQNRRASRVLVYTPQGRAIVANLTGMTTEKIASFDNATDTDRLRQALDAAGPEMVEAFRREHGIAASRQMALYVGALESYKRIDILVDAARSVLRRTDVEWHLVVAGDGPERPILQSLADETGRVTLLGRVGPEGYAPAAVAASVLLNPGRIGLVAVDALVIGLPILTTASAEHAPEHSYLKEGRDVVLGGDDARTFAETWIETQWLRSNNPETPFGTSRSAGIIASTLLSTVPPLPRKLRRKRN